MSGLGIADLDELVLTVRSRESRTYILEAVQAYRAGAYRAAVISTWIAVSFDIISKIRELANHGDPGAIQFITDLETAIQSKATVKLQNIESSLLEQAREKFEFLSSVEHTDLTRLKEDRNMCAHPSFVADDVLFQPSPELVRTHIVHAVEQLLRHPPVQGKAAIDRILADMQRLSFPEDAESVSKFMIAKYLDRAKEVLIRNLIVVLLKELFKPKHSSVGDQKILNVLMAVSNRHTKTYETVISEKISDLVSPLSDADFNQVFVLISVDRRVWNWLPEADRLRAKGAVQSCEPEDHIFSLVDIPELSEVVAEAIMSQSAESVMSTIKRYPSEHFIKFTVSLFNSALDPQWSGLACPPIISMAPFLSPVHIKSLLERIQEKTGFHLKHMPNFLERLFDASKKSLIATGPVWVSFFQSIKDESHDAQTRYSGLRKRLEENNLI